MANTKILVCCHANRCRSPIGEFLLQKKLLARNKSDYAVSSAGFLESGAPADPSSVAVLAEDGIDASEHISTQISAHAIEDANLILVMERAQVRELAVAYRAFAKTFTIKEFARRIDSVPALAGEEFDQWIERVHEGRTAADLMGFSAVDDVDDPIGQPIDAFRRTRSELTVAIDEIVEAIP